MDDNILEVKDTELNEVLKWLITHSIKCKLRWNGTTKKYEIRFEI